MTAHFHIHTNSSLEMNRARNKNKEANTKGGEEREGGRKTYGMYIVTYLRFA
jgi:hypothetical protein